MSAHFLVRPFKRLLRSFDRVAQGDLDADISEDAYSETRQMSQAVQKSLRKLKAVDQSRQEFVSNVSHELKTPITSIRVLADSLMGMEDAPVELYREFMADISDEIDRENQIIEDLLTLVRMDKSAESQMNISQVHINHELEMILKRLRPIAKGSNVELILESIREVTADVDKVKLNLAVTNLVENAIKYNIDSGWVRVTLDADHKYFYVKVADSGIGIPEDSVDHIFERFFRVDIGDWDFVIRKNAPDDALRSRNPEFVEIQQRSVFVKNNPGYFHVISLSFLLQNVMLRFDNSKQLHSKRM